MIKLETGKTRGIITKPAETGRWSDNPDTWTIIGSITGLLTKHPETASPGYLSFHQSELTILIAI
jgi:hypothetical protein